MLLLWASLAISCNEVRGSGKVINQKRSVSEFTGVDVGGAIAIDVSQSAERSVEVEADDNVLPYVETVVENGILHIHMKEGSMFNNTSIHVKVSLPKLESLEVSGASKAIAKDIHSDKIKVEVSGASKVIINGTAKEAEYAVSGASTLKAKELVADNVAVECSGASSGHVYANTKLLANATGASHIGYSGSVNDVDRQESGASSISKD